MKSDAEFESFYHEQLHPDVVDIEARRKKTARVLTIILVVAVAVFTVHAFMDWSGNGRVFNKEFFKGRMFPGLTLGSLFLVVWSAMTAGIKHDFKEKVIKRMIPFLDPGLRYDVKGFIPQRVFEESGLFREKPETYKGEDLVSGRIGKTDFQFSELDARYRFRGSGRNAESRLVTLFDGPFYVADFNKHFSGSTYVFPDIGEKLIGHVADILQRHGHGGVYGEFVKVEDPEFENYFAVYSSDQVEARYILSTSLMSRLTEFRKKADTRLSIAFRSSKVFIAMNTTKNYFEVPTFSPLDFAGVKKYFEDVMLVVGIVDDLNLNTRIWTKQ